MSGENYSLDTVQLQKYLPHRPPFLMVDRILEIQPQGDLDNLDSAGREGTKVVGIKSVSINEPHLRGHFPGFPIMPGVLIVEALAQVAGFSLYPQAVRKDLEAFRKGFNLILVGVNSARFKRPVVPGDSLRLETVVKKTRGKLWIFDGKAEVDSKTVAQAEIMANLIPSEGI